MKKIILISITLFMLISLTANGQNKKKKKNVAQPELDSGTIEQQFDYIITKSSKFRDFQLIRKTSILKVKTNALDSIKTVRKDLVSANKSVTQIEGNISRLENEVNVLKQDIETLSDEVDSISFMGMALSKTNYNTFVWVIILVLLLALVFFITRFKNSNLVTKRIKDDLSKMEDEFENFRKKSMKKEQETMRKLQDEINKNSH